MSRPLLIATSLCLLPACASSGAAGAHRTRHGSADVITAEEIAAKPEFTSAYDAVEMLRPQFLRSRGQTSLDASSSTPMTQPLPAVFLDNQQYGTVESLRQIPIIDVQEIRYISAADATTRFGTGFPNGVIQVVRRTR